MLHHRLRIPRPTATFAFVASSKSDLGSTITVPATAAAGDLAVLLDRAGAGTYVPTTVVPTNWTSISNQGGGSFLQYARQILSYKILASGDPGATITGMNGTVNSKVMLVFRPSAAMAAVIEDVNEELTSSTPSSQVVEATTKPYVVIGGTGTSGTPTWDTSWYDATVSATRIELAYKLFNTTPANVTISVPDGGNTNVLQSCAIRWSAS